jgi:hypothetical protein
MINFMDSARWRPSTTLIVNRMKDAGMFAGQGGPIILAQVSMYMGACAHYFLFHLSSTGVLLVPI